MVGDNRGVFGGPETCTRILKRIIEVVGTTHIGLTSTSAAQVTTKSSTMERFGAPGDARP